MAGISITLRDLKDFPGGSVVKNLPANAGDAGDVDSIPGLRRSPGEEHCNPLQYSCLEEPMDREAWQAAVHSITQSQTRLKQLNKWFSNMDSRQSSYSDAVK